MGLKHFFRCIGHSLRSLKGGRASRRQLRDYQSATYHRVAQDSLEGVNSASSARMGSRRLQRFTSSFGGSRAFDRELEERLSLTTARMEDIRRQTFVGSPASPLGSSVVSDAPTPIECVPGTSIPLCDTEDAEEVVKVYARLMAAKREFEIAEQELKHVQSQAEHVQTHGRRSASKLPPPPPHMLVAKRAAPRSTWV
ncbi:hypothetical protein PybrP1_002008 [[Pythium] brassicae (nom. inval.)]|nr:hypothetical protein PybrP1_002008 [[Pythium] brassicae (nom. inval.)]